MRRGLDLLGGRRVVLLLHVYIADLALLALEVVVEVLAEVEGGLGGRGVVVLRSVVLELNIVGVQLVVHLFYKL